MGSPRLTVAERLERLSSPEPNTGCFLWLGSLDSKGYAVLGGRRGQTKMYRAAYEAAKGPIPTGLAIDHVCCNRWCVNPDHMDAVTREENTRRGFARQTKCRRQGHPRTGDNVRVKRRKNGRLERECVACCRERALAYYRRNAERLSAQKRALRAQRPTPNPTHSTGNEAVNE